MERERVSDGAVQDAQGPLALLARETLTLASQSPRRAEILRTVGWPFEAEAADVDETLRAGEACERYVERLAREKAETVAGRRLFGLVLGADTVVVVDGEILGKPRDDDEARRMLRRLRGRWHEVVTGVALVRAETKQVITAHERTRVRFAQMTDAEVDWYVATNEPADKAGAYAAQGQGALFIEAIDGDYWNVVGLPVRLVYKLSAEI
jgi:septum formation protein